MNVKLRALYAAGGLCACALILLSIFLSRAPDAIRGAVIAADADPARELPVGNVEISIQGGPAKSSVRSDTSGAFTLPLPWRLRRGQRIALSFRHPDYQNLDLTGVSGDRLCIARLIAVTNTPAPGKTQVAIANVAVRYSISTTTTINVGSAVRTFQIANRGNVPCQARRPCSPDGKWKAAEGSATIDAGPGNEFRNARASCIAGPCPFTRIDNDAPELSRAGRTLRVNALNWSDTATFLLEAEVYKTSANDLLRRSYPLILDRALTFTLPAAAEGVSIEAEFDHAEIVFPLGPSLYLSWADCQQVVNKDKTLVYRCELRTGYRFAAPASVRTRPIDRARTPRAEVSSPGHRVRQTGSILGFLVQRTHACSPPDWNCHAICCEFERRRLAETLVAKCNQK